MCWRMRLAPLTKGGCDEVDYTVAFTPKGGCPLKQMEPYSYAVIVHRVAFTPKGGCPLKREVRYFPCRDVSCVAFTPKGGCPLKLVFSEEGC